MRKFLASVVLGFAAVVGFAFSAQPAQAATYTWDGGGATTAWSDCPNWSTNVCPVAGDSIVFNATSTKDSSADAGWGGSITSITIAAGYTGTISVDRSLALSGTFSLASGTFSGNAETIDFNGTVSITGGTFNASSGTMLLSGNFTHTAGGTFNHNGGTMVVDGTGSPTWDVNVSESLGSLTLDNSNATLSLTVATGDTLNVNGTLVLTDGSYGTGTIAAKGAVSIGTNFGRAASTSGTLLVNGAGAQAVAIAPPSDFSFEPVDQLTVSNASATVGGTGTTGPINLDKLTVTAGTVDFTGYNLVAQEAVLVNGGTLTLGSGVYAFNGTFAVSSGTFNGGSGNVDVNGAVTFTGGTFNASSGSMQMSANFTHSTGGTFNHNNGNVTVDGSAQVTWDVITSEALYDLTLNNSSALAFIVATGDTLNVDNSLVLTDGSLQTGTIAAKGAVSVGANFGIASNGSGTLLVNGAGAQAVTIAPQSNATFELVDQLTVNNASATVSGAGAAGLIAFDKVTVTAGTVDLTGYTFLSQEAVTVSGGTLTFGAGTQTFASTLAVSLGTFNGGSSTIDFNGGVTVSGGTLNASSGTMLLSGNFTHTAGGTFNHNGGNVTVDGTGLVTWNVATSEEFYDFTLNNSNATLSLTVSSGDTLIVNNLLTLTDGSYDTGTIAAKGAVTIGDNFGRAASSSGVLLVNGSGAQAVTIAPQSNVTFEPVDQFTVNNASATVGGTGASAPINLDKITVTAGTVDFTGYNLVAQEALTVNGGTFTLGSGVHALNGTVAVSAGTFNGGSGDVAVAGAITISGGAFNASSGTMSFAGTYTHTAGGTFGHNDGTISATGAAAAWDVATSETFNNLTIAKTSAASLNMGAGDTFTVNGALTLTDGRFATGTIAAKAGVAVAATWDGGSGNVLLLNGAGSQSMTQAAGAAEPAATLRVNNASAAVSGSGTGTLTFGAVDLQAGTVDFTGYGVNLSGAYTQSGGTFTGGSGAVSLASTLTLSGGTFTSTSGTLSLAGNFTHTAGGTFSHNGGTFRATGSTDGTYDVATTETFYNFEVAKTTNWLMAVSSPDTLVVENALTFTDGRGNGGTIEAKGSVSVASTYDYGNLGLTFSGTGDQSFALPTGQTASWDMLQLRVDKASGTFTLASDVILDCTGAACNVLLSQGAIDLGGFALRANDLTVNGGTFTAGASTLDVGDDLLITGGTFNASSGTTFLGGDFTHTAGGIFNHNNGLVEFDTQQDQTIDVSVTETFYSVRINKGGYQQTITSGDTIVVTGDLTMTTGRFMVGTIDMRGAATVLAATYTGGNSAALLFAGSAEQTFDLTGATALFDGNLTVNKTGGTLSLLSAITMESGRTFSLQGGTFAPGANLVATQIFSQSGGIYSGAAGNLDVNAAFTLSGGTFTAPSGTMYVGTTFTHTAGGTFAHNNGTVEFDQTSNTAYDVAVSETFNNVTMNKSGFIGAIASGDRFIVLGQLNFATGRFTGGTLEAHGDVTVSAAYGVGDTALTFSGSADQTFTLGVAANLDGDVTVNKTGGTVLQSGALTLNATSQDLVVAAGAYDLDGSNLTVNGPSGVIAVQDGGVLQLQGGETITANGGSPSFTQNSLVRYDGTATDSPYVLKNYGYGDLEIAGGAGSIFAPAATLSVGGDLTITSGILSLAGNNATVTGAFSNLGTFRLRGSETVTLTNDADSGTVQYVGDADGAADAFSLKDWDYYHLSVSSVDAADTFNAAASPLDVLGTFTLENGVFGAPTLLNLTGDFARAGGTFTHNDGTVALVGASQALSGSTTFFNLTKIVGGAATLTLPAAATQTVLGTLTLQGILGDLLSLRSSVPGSRASVDPQGTRSFSYLDVQDNDNVAASPASCSTGCVDGGNNDNWAFSIPSITVAQTDGGTVVTEGGAGDTVSVVLGTQPSADVTVNVSGGAQLSVLPTSVTFTTGNWDTPQDVAVSAVNDLVAEGAHLGEITFTVTSVGDAGYNGYSVAPVSVTVADDDAAGFTVSAISGNTTEAGGTAAFTVVLTSQPVASVTVGVTSSDLTEGTVSPASLTFTTENWNVPQTVTLTGVDDASDDGDVAYSVVLAAATSADGAYNGLNPSDVSATNTDDDTAGVTVSLISGNTTEAGGTATFTVVLASQPSSNVVVGLSSSDTTEGTVSPASLTFTNANWATPRTVTVTGVNDSLDDGDVAYSIITAAATSSDLSYSGLNPSDVSAANADNDISGFTVSVISGNTSENGGTATFTVALTAQPTATVTVGVSSSDVTEGTVSPATLTFTTGDWNQAHTVTVTGVDDVLVDGDIAYAVALAAASSSDLNYNGLNPSDVSATNDDNDTAGVNVSAVSGSTTEAGGTATFTVVLASQPTADVTIPVSTSDATEGAVSTASLTFTAGDWDQPQTVTVTGADDSLDDGDVAYSVVLGAASSVDPAYDAFNPSDVSVTNTDNDAAGFTVSAISGNTTEAGGTATFTVRLTSQPTADVTVGVSSSDTSEGTVSPASLTFTAVDWNDPHTVTVTGVDDLVDDGDIAYSILTAAATSADGSYNALNPANVSVTNADDDDAGFIVSAISGNTTEAGGTATFTVRLTSQPSVNAVIPLSSSDLTEGTVSPSSLTFTSDTWNVPQTVTVTGVDDATDDGDVAYAVVLGTVTGGPAYDGLNPDDVSVTNADDDANADIVVSAVSGNTSENGGTATFTVVLASLPSADVTVGVSSSDLTEGTVSPSSLTFTALTWNVPQTVTVTGVDDDADDGGIAYSVILAAAVSDDVLYAGLNPADVDVTNADDDVAGITVSAISGNTTEAGGTATFTVVLDTRPSADVTVGVSSSDAGEAGVSPSSVVFTSLTWNTPQTITVTGVDDASVDGDVAASAVLAAAVSDDVLYAGLNPADVAVTNEDDDVAGVLVTESGGTTEVSEDGTADTYEVVLTARPESNVVVTVTAGALLAVDAATFTFAPGTWNVPQTVTVSVVSDDLASGDTSPSVTHAVDSDDLAFDGLSAASVSVLRHDDDTAGFTIIPISGNTTEEGGQASFTVVLTSRPTADVTVAVATSNAAEGTVSAESVTFLPDAWNLPRTVTVTGVDDEVVDGAVAFSVTLGPVTSADATYAALDPADVAVTNEDDDVPAVLVTATEGVTRVTEAGATDTYALVLSAQPAFDVVVGVSPDGVDADVSMVTFTPETWNVPQDVTVSVADDAIAQGTRARTVVHATTSDDPAFDGLSVASMEVVILDDDVAGITVSAISGTVPEAGGTATFTLVLTSQPTADVSVAVTSSDVTEGTPSPGTVTFTSDTWNVPQTVTVTGADDAVDDGSVAYALVTAAAVSDDGVYAGINPADVSASSVDDDTAGITLTETDGTTEVAEGGTVDAYAVVLDSQPTASVSVFFIGDADVSTSVSQLTFTADTWNVPQAVTVSAVEDSVVESEEVHSVLHIVSSSDPLYGAVTLGGVPVTVGDNDEEGAEEESGSGGGSGGGGGGGGQPSSSPTAISLTLRNPSSGTAYPLGSTRVSWSWTGSIPAVNVYLSWDDGETWSLQRYFITNVGSTLVSFDRESDAVRVRVEGTDFIRTLVQAETGAFAVSATVAVDPSEEKPTEQQALAEAAAIAVVDARVAALPASFGGLHGLVKLVDDGDAETQYDSTVYYVGADGTRHAFPNNKVFDSWFCAPPPVREVSVADMAVVPLGTNVTYRPGSRLVKFLTDPRVYAIDADGSLRWVLSEGDAETLYGVDWRTKVDDIMDTFYRNYRFGAVLTDLSWNPLTVMSSVAFPSDVMHVPGYMASPDTGECLPQ